MVVASSCALMFALSIFFFVPLHPSHVGLVIEDMTANELLIATVLENKDAFDKVLIDDDQIERSQSVADKVADLKNT
jgi:hypothetical protein